MIELCVFFFRSVADLFEQCFDLRSSKKSKHLRAIELEKNFSECRVKSSSASIAWEEILLEQGLKKMPLVTACFNIYSSTSGVRLGLSSVRIMRRLLQMSTKQDPKQMTWSLRQFPIEP